MAYYTAKLRDNKMLVDKSTTLELIGEVQTIVSSEELKIYTEQKRVISFRPLTQDELLSLCLVEDIEYKPTPKQVLTRLVDNI